MNKTPLYLLLVIGAMFATLIGTLGLIQARQPLVYPDSGLFGSVSDPNKWYITSTSSAMAVGPGVSSRILATSSVRTYARLQSLAGDTQNPVYCNLSDTAAVLGTGVLITASSTFTIDPENLYTGSIQCVSKASTTLSVIANQ